MGMLQPDPRKNGDKLIAAVADVFIDSQFDGIGLAAVGSSAALRFYRDDLLRIDGRRLIRHSALDDATFVALLRGAMTFVYPSLYEGFGLPPLEAMAAGCPVIVVPNSSLVEVVGDAGVYAHDGSASDLARAIRLVLASESLRSSLRLRGLERAGLFSWERMVESTIELYDRATLMKGKHHD